MSRPPLWSDNDPHRTLADNDNTRRRYAPQSPRPRWDRLLAIIAGVLTLVVVVAIIFYKLGQQGKPTPTPTLTLASPITTGIVGTPGATPVAATCPALPDAAKNAQTGGTIQYMSYYALTLPPNSVSYYLKSEDREDSQRAQYRTLHVCTPGMTMQAITTALGKMSDWQTCGNLCWQASIQYNGGPITKIIHLQNAQQQNGVTTYDLFLQLNASLSNQKTATITDSNVGFVTAGQTDVTWLGNGQLLLGPTTLYAPCAGTGLPFAQLHQLSYTGNNGQPLSVNERTTACLKTSSGALVGLDASYTNGPSVALTWVAYVTGFI